MSMLMILCSCSNSCTAASLSWAAASRSCATNLRSARDRRSFECSSCHSSYADLSIDIFCNTSRQAEDDDELGAAFLCFFALSRPIGHSEGCPSPASEVRSPATMVGADLWVKEASQSFHFVSVRRMHQQCV